MPSEPRLLTPPHAFGLFGTDHLIALAVTLAVIAATCAWGRRQSPAGAASASRVLAAGLVLFYGLECYLRLTWLDEPPLKVLPLQICDVLFLVGAYAHWSQKRWAHDLLFFWTFAGTSHALITPALAVGAPEPEFFRYFFSHGLLVLSAAYGAIVTRKLPQPGSALRAVVALHAWALLVLFVDLVVGANFLFLLGKPEEATLLDGFGPWPWYLLGIEAVVVVTFSLLNLPFVALRRRNARRRGVSAAEPDKGVVLAAKAGHT